jgi:hypothetical protein
MIDHNPTHMTSHVCWPCTPSWHFLSRWGCFLTTLDLHVPGVGAWALDTVLAGDHRLPDQLVEASLQLVQPICIRSAGRSLSVRSWGLISGIIHLCIVIPFMYLWYSIIVILYLISVISTYLYSDRLVCIFITLASAPWLFLISRPRVHTLSISTPRMCPPVASPYPPGWSVTSWYQSLGFRW